MPATAGMPKSKPRTAGSSVWVPFNQKIIQGHADRSAYDLNAHMNSAKVSLQASRRIEPVQKTFVTIQLNKPLLGKSFKQDQSKIVAYVENMSEEAKL